MQAGYLPRKRCAPNKSLFAPDRLSDEPRSSANPSVIEHPGEVTGNSESLEFGKQGRELKVLNLFPAIFSESTLTKLYEA